mgnify:CR=1 FL=1
MVVGDADVGDGRGYGGCDNGRRMYCWNYQNRPSWKYVNRYLPPRPVAVVPTVVVAPAVAAVAVAVVVVVPVAGQAGQPSSSLSPLFYQ